MRAWRHHAQSGTTDKQTSPRWIAKIQYRQARQQHSSPWAGSEGAAPLTRVHVVQNPSTPNSLPWSNYLHALRALRALRALLTRRHRRCDHGVVPRLRRSSASGRWPLLRLVLLANYRKGPLLRCAGVARSCIRRWSSRRAKPHLRGHDAWRGFWRGPC